MSDQKSDHTSEDSELSIPPEVPEADRLEQARDEEAKPMERDVPRSTRAGFGVEEASEADILEQSEEVPFDDDSYR
jgi:hypothetical protein